jgi:hypothetical protein
MATPSPAPPATAPIPFYVSARKHVKPFLAPYYLTIAAVLGGMTAAFVALIAVLILLATNFNVLGWME